MERSYRLLHFKFRPALSWMSIIDDQILQARKGLGKDGEQLTNFTTVFFRMNKILKGSCLLESVNVSYFRVLRSTYEKLSCTQICKKEDESMPEHLPTVVILSICNGNRSSIGTHSNEVCIFMSYCYTDIFVMALRN